jgi:transcriptional regulator with XRE-family HTH domain
VYNSVTEISADVARLRKEGGKWLKSLREQRGLSQKELAELVDVQFHTFISQLENGRGRIPPERYESWATALDIPCHHFVERVLSFYDPMTHRILFEGRAVSTSAPPPQTDEPQLQQIDDLHRLLGRQTAAIELLRERLSSSQ